MGRTYGASNCVGPPAPQWSATKNPADHSVPMVGNPEVIEERVSTFDNRAPPRSGLLGVSCFHCPLTALSGPSEHPRQETIGLTSFPELFHGLFRLCSHLSPPLLGGFRNLRSTSFRENSLFYPR